MKNITPVLDDTSTPQQNANHLFTQWLEQVRSTYTENECALFEQAYSETRDKIGARLTDSGEPWITHVVAVATILCDLHLDASALCASLLLPLVGETGFDEEAIAKRYDKDVVTLMKGTWQMREIHVLPKNLDKNEQNQQAENLRKMLLSMVEDIRVVLIKLAERLQTIRTITRHEDNEQKQNIAREIADLFAPLANRLGVWQIKWELEDLSLRILAPDEYRYIANLLDERQIDRQRYIENVIEMLKKELSAAKIKADVTGRPKHIYSIWNKMRRKQTELEGLYDIRAVRILVDDVKDCYTALGIVHNMWTPIPREFDDYIAKPKANNYQSLHTAVIGPENKSVEIQIRTWKMHQHSEYGVAAHWRYKEKSYAQKVNVRGSVGNGKSSESNFEQKIAWLRQILEWKDFISDDREILSAFKSNIFSDTIYVLTPQGRVIDLPNGSTPLDFAYSVHTSLGHRCRGAKVNGQMVPLNYTLKNGQRVEIIAAKQGGPSRDWLNGELRYVISHRSRTKIRQWFKQQQLEETVAQGRTIVEKEMARAGASAIKLETLAHHGKFASADDLFAAVARDEINSRQLQQLILGVAKPDATTESKTHDDIIETRTPTVERKRKYSADSSILIVGIDRLMTNLAKCCKPAPPDAIAGFVTRGKGVSIHRENCENLLRIQEEHPERIIEADWGDTKESVFPVDIVVDANDRPGLLRDLSEVFSRDHMRLTSANMQSRKHQTRIYFTIEVQGIDQLQHSLDEARNITGVINVARQI
ncbi:MAG: bifunctional (p)ppGpp synthetase/guanosine-3',5'-bis(diphosphate) 3'-pyrophosphohydrolase [Burkholderiales bacterium]|jgi:GTP pyrophosphokinase|nr:bifunctional (p)ppGpp synthetase/guanosine-3',5'-bis(diphosphate) 3'-pyrophosphohydrolase [Burkholderiales bacterium]